MVNMEEVPNFEAVLDDFFLPSIHQDDLPSPILVLCPSENMDIWRSWAAENNASLIVLPQNSYDLNRCDLLWRRIFQRINCNKFCSKQQLWEQVADAFDFITLHNSVQFQAALSMRERIEKLDHAAGGPVFQ